MTTELLFTINLFDISNKKLYMFERLVQLQVHTAGLFPDQNDTKIPHPR